MARSLLFGSLVALGAACNAVDGSLLQQKSGSVVVPETDADDDDSPPSSRCGPDFDPDAPELCNGEDDDCDGEVDEGASADCELPNAQAVCTAGGQCAVGECDPDYLDCNDSHDDGCEAGAAEAPCDCTGECPDDVTDADAGVDTLGDGGSADAMTPDAGMEPEPDPMCEPVEETCNGEDDDCDGASDEGGVCLLQECINAGPSHRGADCDACVCTSCRAEVVGCQLSADADAAMRCDDLVACYVANACTDCYTGGECAAEVHLATGVDDPMDATYVGTRCAADAPYPCGSATAYRACLDANCATECSD